MIYDQNPPLDSEGNAIPFDHGQRLADKLFGAVNMALDNITADIRIQNAKNERAYAEASGQISILPPAMSQFISRNSSLLVGMFLTYLLVVGAMAFLRR